MTRCQNGVTKPKQAAAMSLPPFLNIICPRPSGRCVSIGPEHLRLNQTVQYRRPS